MVWRLEPVGIGEEVAFERGGLRVEIADERGVAGGFQEFGGGEEAQLLDRGGDIEHVPAFGHDQLVVEDIAARDAADHFHGAGGAVEAVLAGLQDAPCGWRSGPAENPIGERTTPAFASVSAMPLVPVPWGNSTKVSPWKP